MKNYISGVFGFIFLLFLQFSFVQQTSNSPLDYTIVPDVITSGYDGEHSWFHPRAGVIPGKKPVIVLTLQQWLVSRSDVFYPLADIRSEDYGKTWSKPHVNEVTLGRRPEAGGGEVGVSDFTPKWHSKFGKLLGTGHTIRYKDNHLAKGVSRSTTWSVYDEKNQSWSDWAILKTPEDSIFYNEGAGCTQRIDLPNGDILLPTYFHSAKTGLYSVTILRCGFNGKELSYKGHGNVLRYPTGRGFCEPSLTLFKNTYFLTIRNNDSAYVAVSKDGMNFNQPKVWRFDDGQELGSYNTQQHWVTHHDGLFLVYTRKGANNDNVMRHRAPLFIAEVDPERLLIKKKTERVLVPNKGAQLGNFGVVNVSEDETWVTTSEGMSKTAANYGADNRLYAVRLRWNKPNKGWDR